ncbi:chymotrypsin family serine protease [Ekhidna sp.]
MMDKNLVRLHNELVSRYRDNESIRSIDIGYRFDGNEYNDDEYCVTINTIDSGFENYVSLSDRKNVNVVVRETLVTDHISRQGVRPVKNDRTKRQTKISPGISIGFGDTGTLGTFCYDKLNNNRLSILTCFHVIKSTRKGVPVMQPGVVKDGGNIRRDAIGNYVRRDPNGDSAIARFNGRRQKSDIIYGMGLSVKSTAKASIGDVLHKSGRTTGVTHAKVSARSVYFRNINHRRIGIPGFKLVPAVGGPPEISLPGDSGALWINQATRQACGLHFAGEKLTNPGAEFALAQDISHVLTRLNVSLIKPRR